MVGMGGEGAEESNQEDRALHSWTTTGMVPFVAGCQKHSSALRAAFARQVCQGRIQGSLSRSVLIWVPSGRGRVILPGSCTLEPLPGKKNPSKWSCEGKAWSEFTAALLSPPPSLPPGIILCFSYKEHGHQPPNIPSSHLHSVSGGWFSSRWKGWNRHFLLSLRPAGFTSSQLWLKNAAKMAFGAPGVVRIHPECSPTPWPLGQSWSWEGEGFAQPRIPSWECPETPLRTHRIPLQKHMAPLGLSNL